ncbi:MAG TPA: phenylalanine--tRNA ligase subunit alpha [Candidatus Levybacteria bacterium]|nr:phenylalanine--tRNA ligase subunit alpha [Candidatus Levybacteria bacterium]
MEHDLLNIKNDAVSMILAAENAHELNKIKLDYIGRNGRLTTALKELPKVSVEKRPIIGKLANEVKTAIEEMIEDKFQSFKTAKKSKKYSIDVTAPGIKPPTGHLHLVTQAIDEITAIFEKIGFTRVRYPEIEWDWYAFEALNFPDMHPARDDWETFFIDAPIDPKKGPMVLTPHTSSGQIREMEQAAKQNGEEISIKMVNIAKTYRRQSDVSHTQMFHQFETLVIGEKISITHLKGVLDYFVKSYFGEKRKSRIRPYHFQFTEPSFETDVSCGICDGKGCKLCKEGWLEMGGAGMVHPNVIANAGLDPKKYSGFASGWGVERVLMMKEGMELDDLRLLYGNDLRFLEQF